MTTLPLNDIAQVTVNINPVAAIRNGFNLGLIVGNSTIISATDRVKVYSSLTAIIADGFLTTSAEYIAAQLYFAQFPTPSRVAIGRCGVSSETFVQALIACRAANSEWYAFTVVSTALAEATDIATIAAWAETATPSCIYFYTVNVLANITSIFSALKTAKYRRSIGQFATIVSPATVNYAVVAIMGYAMGANYTGSKAYDLAYKPEVGVTPEVLTSAQLTSILAVNGNAYVNQGGSYNLFRQGLMADGSHFDEVLGLDTLVNDLQTSIVNALMASPKIPQTEGGMTVLTTALTTALESARTKGFIAPGVWLAPTVLSLNTGDTLSMGYLIQHDPIESQSQADRANRIAPPIYVCIKLAGAIEYVSIVLNVNR